MAGDGFSTFYWEFLCNAIPSEISLNYCSHGCPFCFANLNSMDQHRRKGQPLRYADTKSIMALLRDFHKRKSIEAFWLREGYPVLISNKVDPFANSNFRVTLPILEVMTELDIPIAFQTRGGRGIDEALEFLKPSVWYISIDHSDDATRKQIAPANPSIEERYELIAKLKSHGHEVVLGLNPLSLEWVPEPEKILQRCKDLGVWGVWTELMHFNENQIRAARSQGGMPEEMLSRYRIRKTINPENFDHLLRTRAMAREIGLEVYGTGQSTYSRYWDAFKRTYPKVLPTLQDWVNHAHEQGWESDRLISFHEFSDFYLPYLPSEPGLKLGYYIKSLAHEIHREYKERGTPWTDDIDWVEVLRIGWSDPRIRWNPVKTPAFAYCSDGQGGLLRDEQGVPYMTFWKEYEEFLAEAI